MIAARYTPAMSTALDRKVGKEQLALPDEIRQSVVLLRFAEPVPRTQTKLETYLMIIGKC